MTVTTEQTEIIVCRKPNDHRPEDQDYVWVGQFRSQSTRGGAGDGAQAWGICVAGNSARLGQVYKTLVRGESRYERETINRIGTRGAYRELRPDPEQVEQAIETAKAAIRRARAAE